MRRTGLLPGEGFSDGEAPPCLPAGRPIARCCCRAAFPLGPFHFLSESWIPFEFIFLLGHLCCICNIGTEIKTVRLNKMAFFQWLVLQGQGPQTSILLGE